MREAFRTDAALQLAWDNDVRFHVARQLLKLRRYRQLTQTVLADGAGTSQAKIARIESGLANITLETLRRHIEALRGRFCVSISPEEIPCPPMATWWQMLEDDGSRTQWTLRSFSVDISNSMKTAAASWTAECDDTPLEASAIIDAKIVSGDFRLLER